MPQLVSMVQCSGPCSQERWCLVISRRNAWNASTLCLSSLSGFVQVYLVHHVSCDGICPSQHNVCVVEEFPMPKTYTQVHVFCGLAGHYRCFIKGFAHIVHLLYNVLGKVKMGPVQLPPEAQEAVRILKDKIQTMPILVFPDFDKPFLLKTDASKEGLDVVLSQKQGNRWYHPVTFGAASLLFHMCNGLVMSKGLLYVSTVPKGEAEGVLAFLVPTGQCSMALNGVHHNTGHQGQQRTLVLMQE